MSDNQLGPVMQRLESRRLLSTSDTLSIGQITAAGTLVIKGTDGHDGIIVLRQESKIKFTRTTFEGVVGGTVNANEVKRVLVEAGDGDDHVFIDRDLNKRVTVAGGGGHDAIQGNRGATLIGGNGNDQLLVPGPEAVSSGLDFGPSLLSGGGGNDGIVAQTTDSVVGGRGDDLVVAYSALERTEVQLAADFGNRASGIETFDALVIGVVE